MKPYAVQPLNLSNFAAMVIATGWERPSDHLEEIARDLQTQQLKGRIVFDLLLANATRTRRFFAIDFDGETFAPYKFQVLEADAALSQKSAEFFTCNLADVDLALLSEALRFAVKRGIPV